MARQPSLSLGAFLLLFICPISAALDDCPSCRASPRVPVVSRNRSYLITGRIPRDVVDPTVNILTSTPTHTAANPSLKVVSTASAPRPLVTVLDSILDRRDLGIIISTISSLQVALASASANASSLSDELSSALSASEELVSSLDYLRASTESLSLSASSALLAARASASSALSAAEASADLALSAAQESASSSISEALAMATPIGGKPPDATWQTQKGVSRDEPSVSPAVIGGVVAASVVGTSLLSFIVVWLYMRKRKAKQRELEEENQVNAALDRAIVSYIVKEYPSPQGPGGSVNGSQTQERSVGTDMPEYLEPSPPSPFSPLSPLSPQTAPISEVAMDSQLEPRLQPTPSPKSAQSLPARRPSHFSKRPQRPPRPEPLSLPQQLIASPPVPPSPPSPMTRLPAKAHKPSKSMPSISSSSTNASMYDPGTASSSTGISRAFSRRTASSHFIDDAEKVYGDILISPLEITSPLPPARTRPRRNTEPPERPERTGTEPPERREDVGWPLTKQTWL